MALEINPHIRRLAAFQPAGASGGQLLAEVSDTPASDELRTKARAFVSTVVDAPGTRLVVLTGDAGHGKTHICRQLIAEFSPEGDARQIILDGADGRQDLAVLPSGRALRVIKDLSELSEQEGSDRLVEALTDAARVTVVCANEGRLRIAVQLSNGLLEEVRSSLDQVLAVGCTQASGNGVHVLDMNHQSVSTEADESLVLQLIRTWVQDQRKWVTCQRCDAKPLCPIYENQRLLAAEGDRGESRRQGLSALLRLAEQTGHVVTIRELLIFMSHSLTGGLTCPEVHNHVRRRPGDKTWQHPFLFHQAAFGDLLGPGDHARLRVFAASRLLDPGRYAVRPVDDGLALGESSDEEGHFLPPEPVSDGATARTQKAMRSQASRHRSMIRFLRRRSYFDSEVSSGRLHVSFADRCGLSNHDAFSLLLREDVEQTDKVAVRNQLLAGLEAVQGARRRPGQASFLIVDPAFSSHRGSASVVALQVPLPHIRLMSQTEYWDMTASSPPNLGSALDWVDRRIVVVMLGRDAERIAIDLDCRQFELVMRAGHGLVSRNFFQADIRRLMSQLALAVETGADPESAEITVLIGGARRKLVIDVGDTVVATEV